MATLRWGILTTGAIAHTFARALAASRTGDAVAVASRSAESARAFAAEHDLPRWYGSYDDLLADPEVDAVYVAMPNTFHARWSIRALEAGKHVLCEKPLALNHPEAMAVTEAARRTGRLLAEAFMHRLHPQTKRLAEIVASGAIGELRLVDILWGFDAPYDPDDRISSPSLGGGAILDIGCYGVSLARQLAGAAGGRAFDDPVEVTGSARFTDSGVDETAVASLRFPTGVLAQVAVSTRLEVGSHVTLHGTGGTVVVDQPSWAAHHGPTTLAVSVNGSRADEVVPFDGDVFALEADAFAAHTGDVEVPELSLDDSLGNARALDDWRESIGLLFPGETLEAATPPVHGRPVRPRPESAMRYGRIPGVDKAASRLVLGTSYRGFMPHATVLLDEYFELGGTVLDTAWVYGDGLHEQMVGRWIESRGVRDEVVLIGKGAHSPLCTPEHLVEQLHESLERLRTDHVDIYLLHRDNESVPVGEFVEVLNEQRDAGRLEAFGGSNWSVERMQAANEYARERGLVSMTALSNQLSLARILEPPWEGCLDAGDPASLAWLETGAAVLLPWSSQAQGFFARADPNDRSDPELVRCWYSDDNFRRLDRARELAAERGVDVVAVALAWVLAQPFATFPLVGPATLAELRSSLAALDLELSAAERAWLDLRE